MRNFTFFVLTVFAFGVSAQSLKIVDKATGVDKTGETISVFGDAANPEIIYKDIKVVNTSGTDLDIGIKRYRENFVSGVFEYFCWFNCYEATMVDTVPFWEPNKADMEWVTVNGGDSSTLFSAYYRPENKLGESCFRYVFYDWNNFGDSADVIICFDMVTVGENELNIEHGITAYPNPATSQINFDYEFSVPSNNAEIVLFNMLGEEVKTVPLIRQKDRIVIATDGLNRGVYFYSLMVDNQNLSTHKIIVNR